MQNIYTMVLFNAIFLLIGAFMGWLIASNNNKVAVPENMHMMENGFVMNNRMMGMNNAMDGMMMELQGKTGDAFDRAFLEQMIMHHQGAVVMANQVLTTSKRSELLKLATDIISAQNKEIQMMKGWLKSWYGINY